MASVSREAGDQRLCLVNRAAQPVALRLPPELAAGGEQLVLSCDVEADVAAQPPAIERFAIAGGVARLPAYSVSLIGVAGSLSLPEPRARAANVFPRQPHLTLWYEPYAAEQPRFDPAGVYSIDTSRFRDRPVAVVKLDLSALPLQSGQRCQLSFEARSQPASAMVLKFPEPAGTGVEGTRPSGRFVPLTEEYVPHRFRFVHDRDTNQGEITVVLTRETLATGATIDLRNFELGPID